MHREATFVRHHEITRRKVAGASMRFRKVLSFGLVLSGVCALFSGCGSSPAWHGETFNTADAAVQSLVSALRSDDTARLQQILGPAGDDILSSGDPVAD